MANTIRIKRSTGSAAPGSLANAELAYAEGSGSLYIGVGTGGAGGSATTVQKISSSSLFTSQTENTVFAAPYDAPGGVPSFRTLVFSDMPGLLGTLEAKASLSGATFTGGVTFQSQANAITQPTSDNSTKVATTAFVKSLGYSTTTGTVTSVGLSLPSIFTVSNSPVTATGTLTGTLATQAAKAVFIGPTSGAAAAPTFRSLAGTDLPASGLQSMAFTAGAKISLQNANDFGDILLEIIDGGFSVSDQGVLTATSITCNQFSGGVDGFNIDSSNGASFSDGLSVGGDLTVGGNLTVQGSTVTMNTETVNVEDKNMVLGNVATPTTTTGDGGGITVRTAATSAGDKTLTWVNATNSWTSNCGFDIASGSVYRIGGTQIAASSLSNGVTGTGAVVLAAGSPTFTGTPAAPTAAADTNTTQIATTAFVVGQGYLKASTASSTYAPLASPTFSGTVFMGATLRNALNAELVIACYNDTGAGTTYSHKFMPYDGTFALAPNGGGLTFPDATTQTTAFIPNDYLSKQGNLSGIIDAAAARGNLGLGSMATQNASSVSISGGSINGITLDGGSW